MSRASDYIIILIRYPSRIVAVIPSIINTCLGSISYASFLSPRVHRALCQGARHWGARGPTAALGCETALSIARTTRREPRAGPYGPHGVINTPDEVCVYACVCNRYRTPPPSVSSLRLPFLPSRRLASSFFLFEILEALLHGGRMGPVIIGTCKKGTGRPASTLCAALKIRHWVSDAQNWSDRSTR